jgi:hypothetical protein
MSDYRSWFLGWVATVLAVMTAMLPVWAGLLLTASPVVLLVTAWARNPALSGGAVPRGVIGGVLMAPVLAVTVGLLVRRNGAQLRRAEQETLRDAAKLGALKYAASFTSQCLEHTRQTVAPWLANFADGTLSAGPAAAAQAAIYSAEIRDDLYAPGFLTPELRAAVSAYRARGGTVRIKAGSAVREHHLARALLYALVTVLDSGHKITLTLPEDSAADASTRVVVVPPTELLEQIIASVGLDATITTDEQRSVAVLTGSGGQDDPATPPNGEGNSD